MQQVDSEIDRLLTTLRNKMHARGFTQRDVQQALGWGRSYISQLLAKQKKIRIEQVLLILNVIGVDAAEFFVELYAPSLLEADPAADEDRRRAFGQLEALSRDLVKLLRSKGLFTDDELAAAVEAARLG